MDNTPPHPQHTHSHTGSQSVAQSSPQDDTQGHDHCCLPMAGPTYSVTHSHFMVSIVSRITGVTERHTVKLSPWSGSLFSVSQTMSPMSSESASHSITHSPQLALCCTVTFQPRPGPCDLNKIHLWGNDMMSSIYFKILQQSNLWNVRNHLQIIYGIRG